MMQFHFRRAGLLPSGRRAQALWLACLCLACSRSSSIPPSNQQAPPRLDIATEEVLVLGEDSSAPAEELFGRVRTIRTDRRGNLYIPDVGPMVVRVYDRSGTYLRSIGGRGRQPGSFLDITSFDVTPEGEVVVADGLALRLSRFAPTGKLRSTIPLDRRSLLWPRDLKVASWNRLIFLCKMPQTLPDDGRRADADFLVHIFDATMAKRAAFARLEEVVSGDDRIVELFNQLYPGRLWVEDDGAILYAPSLYEGLIYRYQQQDEGWRRTGTLVGHARGEPFVVQDPDQGGREPLVFAMRSSDGRVRAEIHSTSVGLFRMHDGRIVHFTLTRQGKEFVLGTEVFSREGRLLGFGRIQEIPAGNDWSSFWPVTVEWKDEADRFYLLHTRDFPVVQVLRFRFSPAHS